jgi:hypothetical protein
MNWNYIKGILWDDACLSVERERVEPNFLYVKAGEQVIHISLNDEQWQDYLVQVGILRRDLPTPICFVSKGVK